MARSTDTIVALMDAEQATHTELTDLNSPSQTADYTLWKGVIATQINLHEQLMDEQAAEIDEKIAKASAATPVWIKNKVLNHFQYSSTNPQILQVIDDELTYPTIDDTLHAVKKCSVKTDLNKNVKIKVNGTSSTIASAIYSSLVGYLNNILPADMGYTVINLVSDKLYFVADIYYDGQYTSSIQSSVEEAITNYLANLEFDGSVIISDLQEAIKDVSGVKDIKIYTIKARAHTVPLASATTIFDITGTGYNALRWDTVAGVIIPETTPGNMLADTVNYIVA
jgi:hypothetical protein